MKIDNYLIGSDIEVFIKNKDNNKYVSAAGDKFSNYLPIVPGTKLNPYYIDDDKQYAVETDNVSVEFLIPPTRDCDKFIGSINYMMQYIKGMLHMGLIPVAESSAVFDKDQLETEQATMFGCDRDLNAWTKTFNPKPNCNTNLRSNGFHIHVGYDNPNKETSIELIKAMDLYVGLGTIFVDKDIKRRKLYGKAGSFRFKPYGVEYRTPSSFMISHDDYIKYVVDNTVKAIEFINNGFTVSNEQGTLIQKAINENNVDIANKIYETFTEITNEEIKQTV